MDISLNGSHLKKFIDLFSSEETWSYSGLKNYAESIKEFEYEIPSNFCDKEVKRDDLKDLCANKDISDEVCILSILAWGGKRRDQTRALFKEINNVKCIVRKLRNSEINHLDAYEQFSNLRNNNKLKGLGPAFFTKLIFFCHPGHKGFIMDQWTAKSVNLLVGKNVVIINNTFVTDKNTAGNYQNFCEIVEKIAENSDIIKRLSKETYSSYAEQVEIALFSQGRGKGAWREYLKKF